MSDEIRCLVWMCYHQNHEKQICSLSDIKLLVGWSEAKGQGLPTVYCGSFEDGRPPVIINKDG